jgi:hypothetical protein
MKMKKIVGVVVALLVVLVIVWGAILIGNQFGISRLQTGEKPLLRFVFVVIGLLIAFGVYLATRQNKAWEVGTRQVVWMAIGAALYAVFSWLFNASVFVVPSLSQVALRPAIAIPMFFGYAFGPVVGFFTGAVGNMFGDALTGFGLSPQWSIGNGLIGLVAGLPMLFGYKKKSLDTVLIASGVLAAIAVLIYFLNRDVTNGFYFAATEPVSLFAGLAIVIGFILILVSRFLPKIFPAVTGFFAGGLIMVTIAGFMSFLNLTTVAWIVIFLVGALVGLYLGFRLTGSFEKNEVIVTAVTWAMLGNIVGIGFAAISDIWINGYSPAAAVVGEFLPAAGPNLIFAAILVPLLVVAYAAVQRQSGR